MDFYVSLLYNDSTEFELLVGKILTEAELIKEWVIVEGSFSFKGRLKGLHLNELIRQEERLQPFLDRIHVIECTENLVERFPAKKSIELQLEIAGRRLLGKNSESIMRLREERRFFEVEKYSRDLATELILSRASNSDWVFITDVDEIVNMSSSVTKNELVKATKERARFLQVPRRRYVFDFDNLDPRFRTVPLVKVEMLRMADRFKISSFRFLTNGLNLQFSRPPVVEFSYCLGIAGIYQKLKDFSHVSPPDASIRRALTYNHQFQYPGDVETSICWFNTDREIGKYLPNYFAENFASLKTNSVELAFPTNRVREYPDLFTS